MVPALMQNPYREQDQKKLLLNQFWRASLSRHSHRRRRTGLILEHFFANCKKKSRFCAIF